MANKQEAGFTNFVKMMLCLDDVISNAIGIENHNRNNDGYKVDPTLSKVYVLTSAFVDGKEIVPVKLEVKEFKDKPNTLYVAVALRNIKTDGIVTVRDVKNVAQIAPPSEIRLSELFKNINKKDINDICGKIFLAK